MSHLKKSVFVALSIVSTVAVLMSGVSTAEAAGAYDDSTTPTVNTDWHIKNASIAASVLQHIRQTRSKLYDDRSVYFEGVPLQDYVTQHGLTKEQYVNNIQYDRANEEDAYRRAKETRQHGKIGHLGPDGVSEPNYKGRKAWGENIAWGVDAAGSMELWTYRELPALKSSHGYFNGNSGHLYQVLNPDNISFGYGQVSGGPYGEVSTLTLSNYHGDTDYPGGKIGAGESEDTTGAENQSDTPDVAKSTENEDDVNASNPVTAGEADDDAFDSTYDFDNYFGENSGTDNYVADANASSDVSDYSDSDYAELDDINFDDLDLSDLDYSELDAANDKTPDYSTDLDYAELDDINFDDLDLSDLDYSELDSTNNKAPNYSDNAINSDAGNLDDLLAI